jgi:uroporphyrinogen-III synthase
MLQTSLTTTNDRMAEQSRGRIPILLLKTKSVPTDTYEELFHSLDNGRYAPVFVPVLEHRFKRDALSAVRQHVINRGFVPKAQQGRATCGALIFTSQRAVEAFTEVVEEIRAEGALDVDELLPESLPLYVVGPATARGLRALKLRLSRASFWSITTASAQALRSRQYCSWSATRGGI